MNLRLSEELVVERSNKRRRSPSIVIIAHKKPRKSGGNVERDNRTKIAGEGKDTDPNERRDERRQESKLKNKEKLGGNREAKKQTDDEPVSSFPSSHPNNPTNQSGSSIPSNQERASRRRGAPLPLRNMGHVYTQYRQTYQVTQAERRQWVCRYRCDWNETEAYFNS